MKILVACEESQVVTKAFRERGHEAYSCHILPCSGGHPEWHLQQDVREVIVGTWDLIIAHPPCTYLSNSGVCWLHKNPRRYEDMMNSVRFFNIFLGLRCPRVCVENPIQHGYAREFIRKYDQIIQPWQFGHGETKATCLWLVNLPELKPTKIVSGREGRLYKLPPSPDRQRIRSRTYQGIANAMAEQWG